MVRLICNATACARYLKEELGSSKNGFAFLAKRLFSLTWDSIHILVDPEDTAFFQEEVKGFSGPLTLHEIPEPSVSSLLRTVQSFCDSEDVLLWLRADAPLSNTFLAEKVLSSHQQYKAEFTFAEGYPEGFCPQALDAYILPLLLEISLKEDLAYDSSNLIFEIIKKDINNFQIETLLAQKDHRMLRLDFRLNSKANHLLCTNFAPYADLSPEAFEELLGEKAEALRTLPFYLNLEIAEACPQLCSGCPHAKIRGKGILSSQRRMEKAQILELCKQFYALNPEGTLGLSLWGEPALHPEIYEILREIPLVSQNALCLETSGIGWDEERLFSLSDEQSKHLLWIVSLDTLDEDLYRRIRGSGFSTAFQFAQALAKRFPGQVWVQAVRSKDNEATLPDFVKYWKAQNIPVILQKYDHFCNELPDSRVNDISPLERMPCWHIKRDMSVRWDGSLLMCREDLRGEHSLGNAFTENLEDLWKAMNGIYQKHIRQDLPALCRNCDEYYTFNF